MTLWTASPNTANELFRPPVEVSTVGIFHLFLASTAHWTLFSSKLFTPHHTRSWTIASQLSTSMENSIMEVLHWSLRQSLGLPTLHMPSDSSQDSICMRILESFMHAMCPSHLSRQTVGLDIVTECQLF